jgi:hypothetical protein
MGSIGKDMKVLIHDGFILQRFVEHKELVKVVKDKLGIELKFQSIRLECVLEDSRYITQQ